MAGACARKGAEEVTPKGLYFREGRVDERSEIYTALMESHTHAYPLGGCASLLCAIVDVTRTPFGAHTPNKNHMKILHIQNFILPLHPQLGENLNVMAG